MVSYFPVLIAIAIITITVLMLYVMQIDPRNYLRTYGEKFKNDIERADMNISPEDYLLTIAGVGTVLWLITLFVLKGGFLISLLALPLTLALSTVGGVIYLRYRGKQRIAGFTDQLEMVLRMLSGAMRVGLGLRQAIVLVTDEVPDPARREFMRVIGRANIGIPIVDAFDEMARSVPGNEISMFARVVRVQQTTGGDLAKVLEKLATTIRDRRRIMRKMSGLTAQGRFGAFIIGALPLGVGGFVLATQPDMSHALLHTPPGWGMLGGVFVLETLAIISLLKILDLDV